MKPEREREVDLWSSIPTDQVSDHPREDNGQRCSRKLSYYSHFNGFLVKSFGVREIISELRAVQQPEKKHEHCQCSG